MGRGRSSDSEPGELTYEAAEELLARAPELEVLGLLPNSSNYTFLARADPKGASGGPVLAVYKPAEGESPLWDFPSGALYRREVAAYRLSRFLGWPSIPPTVARAGPMGVGAVQLFVASRGDENYFTVRERRPGELLPVALFDFLANNADRKAGHHLVDEEGRMWVIDHGLTFHVEPKLRTVIWGFAGEPLPDRLRRDLERAREALDPGQALAAELGELLAAREVHGLQRRVRTALAPRWRFPAPSSGWSVPWPPV